jgi:hypothetical protein
MWSRKWRNLRPQTLSKCLKMKQPKGTRCYIFRSKCPPPVNKPKILCCNVCPPTYTTKQNPLHWAMSHYPREQAEEASRFCQVDPANVSSCVAWLGLPRGALGLPRGALGLLGKSARCGWSFALSIAVQVMRRLCKEFVIGGESHTHTHNKASANTLALPIDSMLYIYLLCPPHSGHPKQSIPI